MLTLTLNKILSLISLFVVISTSLFGIYTIVSLVTKKIFDEKMPIVPIKLYQILSVMGDGENIEWQVNSLLQRENNVALLDDGLDENGKKICTIICDKQSKVKLFTRENIHTLFEYET